MPSYKYRAINDANARVNGQVEATSESKAYNLLREQGLKPFELHQAGEEDAFWQRRNRRFTPAMAVRYVRQLATLLKAGLPILDAFESLSRSRGQDVVSQRSRAVRKQLRSGSRLSAALADVFPEFPVYVVRLAELGEATGAIPAALDDAANRLEHEARMKAEIRSALSYPMFLASVGTLIVTFMFIFVVPRFDSLIEGNRDSVPAISQAVIGFGVWLQQAWPFVLPALIGAVVAGAVLLRRPGIKQRAGAFLESMPLIGRMLTETSVSRWARTVGIAMKNGASIVDALVLGEGSVESSKLRGELVLVRKAVRAGRNLDDALSDAHYEFGHELIDLVRTGRNSGSLAEMLIFLSDMYEEASRERAKRITALVEPMTIVFIAGIVATIVISVVLAMTSIYEVGL